MVKLAQNARYVSMRQLLAMGARQTIHAQVGAKRLATDSKRRANARLDHLGALTVDCS